MTKKQIKEQTRPIGGKVVARVPDLDDHDAFLLFAARFINQVRIKAGLEPIYDETTGEPLNPGDEADKAEDRPASPYYRTHGRRARKKP